MQPKMFCYQCQETAGCTGCTRVGVCGKQPDVAAMQDLLVYVTKGLSAVTTALRAQREAVEGEINHLITLNLFTTITNANFDKEAIEARIRDTLAVKEKLLAQVEHKEQLPLAALWDGTGSWEAKAAQVGVLSTENEDIRSLRELITYGLKGLSAYSKHANALLQDDGEVDAFLQRALAATLDDSLSADDLVALTMETGKYGVQGMALLDKANTQAYGNPQITKVSIGVGKNPGILVSGHDLRDLEMLLEQTQGTGVDVYTHSEMLPAHYYPAFQKGGVTGIVASIFVDSQYLPYGALSVAMEQISALHCEIEETPDLLMLCTSADDFLRAAETGKIGFLLSFEGAEPVSSCLLLHGFYAAGVRGLGLAWSRRNAAADGCDFSGSLKKGGLTEFGRELVKEAEDLHMILDLSHLSDEGVEDVLSITSCPVIASHSNSRAVDGTKAVADVRAELEKILG